MRSHKGVTGLKSEDHLGYREDSIWLKQSAETGSQILNLEIQ
jgi:hypothetical protein